MQANQKCAPDSEPGTGNGTCWSSPQAANVWVLNMAHMLSFYANGCGHTHTHYIMSATKVSQAPLEMGLRTSRPEVRPRRDTTPLSRWNPASFPARTRSPSCDSSRLGLRMHACII